MLTRGVFLKLSTREKDYVIDALEPSVRDELDTLNEFFADPSWIKVSPPSPPPPRLS